MNASTLQTMLLEASPSADDRARLQRGAHTWLDGDGVSSLTTNHLENIQIGRLMLKREQTAPVRDITSLGGVPIELERMAIPSARRAAALCILRGGRQLRHAPTWALQGRSPKRPVRRAATSFNASQRLLRLAVRGGL